MATYKIKPIEWREEFNTSKRIVGRIDDGKKLIGDISLVGDEFYAYAWASKIQSVFPTLDEAKSFIETSHREFVEQFLERI